MSAKVAVKPAPEAVLSEAVITAADSLSVNQTDLATILGLSDSTISRLRSGAYQLDSSKQVWDTAASFVLVYRSLASILGSNLENMRAWLKSYNRDLASVPMDMLLKPSGLHQVIGYLDAYRGRC